jgi:uncharacterized membrane protein
MNSEINNEAPLHKLELTISKLLRIGVLISGIFLLLGWLGLWLKNGDTLKNFTNYHPEPFLHSFSVAIQSGNIYLILAQVGMILLVCLPLLRVLMTGILFVKQKDNILAIFAFLVFIALVASFYLGVEI